MVLRPEIADRQNASGDAMRSDVPPPPAPQRYRSGYSRFVRLAKYALPLVAGIVVILLVVWPELEPPPDRFRLGMSDINVETAGGQRVVNARFTRVDSANRPFSVTAAAAVQPPESEGRVELSEPQADVTLQGESWVAITSPSGIFWRQKEVLDLTGGVQLYHDDGYEFRTRDARIEFRTGTAWGDDPVRGQGPFGTVVAEGFRIEGNGDRIVFSGKTKMVLYPGKAPKPGKARK
jgi:lipopolysaccharide export system protein LptC